MAGCFCSKYDGSAKQRLTSPGGSGSNVRDLLATWSPDLDQTATGYQGTIAFFRHYDSRDIWGDILAVPADGSRPPVKLRSFSDFTTPPPETGNSTRAMSWSPNGSHLIYVSEGSIWALQVATGEVTKLLDIVWDPVYAGFSKPCFSLDLAPELPGYQGQVAFAVNGNAPPGGGNGSDIGLASVSIDADGEIISAGDWSLLTTSTDWAESQPVWSPDEPSGLVHEAGQCRTAGAGRRIDVFSWASGLSWPVATVLADRVRPTWSPDGTEIGFSELRGTSERKRRSTFFGSRVQVGLRRSM